MQELAEQFASHAGQKALSIVFMESDLRRKAQGQVRHPWKCILKYYHVKLMLPLGSFGRTRGVLWAAVLGGCGTLNVIGPHSS